MRTAPVSFPGVPKPDISEDALLDMIWMARRYAHGRRTFSPSYFNRFYADLVRRNPGLMRREKRDQTIPSWPWASDGSSSVNALPHDHEEIEALLGIS